MNLVTLKKLELCLRGEFFSADFLSSHPMLWKILANWIFCLVQYAKYGQLNNPTIIEVVSPKELEGKSPRIRRDYLGDTSSPKKMAKEIAA